MGFFEVFDQKSQFATENNATQAKNDALKNQTRFNMVYSIYHVLKDPPVLESHLRPPT